MNTFIVSYDLHNEKDYDRLHDAIKAYPNHAYILESLWAVVTDQTAADIHANLSTHTDNDDRLFILRAGPDAHWSNVHTLNSWLHTHL